MAKKFKMAPIHACLCLTVLATLCQTVALVVPSWLLFNTSFIGNVQIGIWYGCVDWKNCKDYMNLRFVGLSQIPDVFTQIIVLPAIVVGAEFIGQALLILSVILFGRSLCKEKTVKLIKINIGLNISACFLIMCGVLSTVTLGGDFGIVNTIGELIKVFNVTFAVSYGYSFYFSNAAAILSLISGFILCCSTNTMGRVIQQRPKSLGSASSSSQEFNSIYKPTTWGMSGLRSSKLRMYQYGV